MSGRNFYNPIEPFAKYSGSKIIGSQLPTPFKKYVGSFGKSFNLSAVIELSNIFDPFIFAVSDTLTSINYAAVGIPVALYV